MSRMSNTTMMQLDRECVMRSCLRGNTIIICDYIAGAGLDTSRTAHDSNSVGHVCELKWGIKRLRPPNEMDFSTTEA